MKNTPIDHIIVKKQISKILSESNLEILGQSKIRNIVKLVNLIEYETGEKFIRMEMGVPGLNPSKFGIDAEKKALDANKASKYPNMEGISELKKEIVLFVKNFLDVKVNEESCVPTVGAMQGSFASFLVANKANKKKDTILFIDPGFPVQKQQVEVLGMKYETFDVYNYRGESLRDKLEFYLSKGNISSILYSNPNNPSWICFSAKELKIIGDLANKYDTIIIEDLAYFAMDFRKDYSKISKPPFQPTVAKYTENYILLISSSKSFSYAGQRIGMLVMSNNLFKREFDDLVITYKSKNFGYCMIFGALYALSSGVAHTVQYGLTGILNAVNTGKLDFVAEIKEYGERAKIMKKLFLENGFKIVYDKDEEEKLADGFYFTISYPGMSGNELLENLIYYGISAIALNTTGSERTEGLRACVSQVKRKQFKDLEFRLKKFKKDF